MFCLHYFFGNNNYFVYNKHSFLSKAFLALKKTYLKYFLSSNNNQTVLNVFKVD